MNPTCDFDMMNVSFLYQLPVCQFRPQSITQHSCICSQQIIGCHYFRETRWSWGELKLLIDHGDV